MILLVDRVILDQGELVGQEILEIHLVALADLLVLVLVVLVIHLEDRKVLILLHLHHWVDP